MSADVDVAVVGGGACGMFAALRAARNPALTVAVFEKSTQHGCNSQVSTGSLAAGGTRFQRAVGLDDSPELHATDILQASGDEDARELVEAVCAVAPSYVDWLADDLHYPVEIGTDMRRGGMSVPRLHTDVGRQGGQRFVRRLREAVAATPNIAFVDNTAVTGLLTGDHGVVGVTVSENGQPAAVRSRSTVLASDGFAANAELVRRHCPDAVDDVFQGVSTSTGDALTWAKDLGAATRNLSSYLGHGLVVPGHATRLNPALPFRGALLVTPAGERFVDEHAHGYSSLGAVLRNLPGRRAIAVWDGRIHTAAMDLELMRESAAAGAFRSYASISALCAALNVDEPGLHRTLQEFVSHDDVLGTDQRLEVPLYAAPITSGILATQGGIDVDAGGRVRLAGGGILPGLYAGGGAAAGISGPDTRGYVSGNGLLSACGLGWILGNALADTCR